MAEEKAIHSEYQKYMDWVYWLKAYSHRFVTCFDDETSELITMSREFSSFDEKTSEQIIDEVLSGEPLQADFSLNATFSPILFKYGALIEPVRKDYDDDNSSRGKIHELLYEADYKITELRVREEKYGRLPDDISAHKIEVIGLDCEQSLKSIQDEIEFLWLENNGLEREAYLKRIALRFGKEVNLSGPYVTRAVGLWLWDFKKGEVAQAIRDFRKKYKDNDVLLQYEDADLRFYHKMTDACIRQTTVFPFTKSKKIGN